MIKIIPFCDVVINVTTDEAEYNRALKAKTKDTSVLSGLGDGGRSTYLVDKKSGMPYFIIGVFKDSIQIITHEVSHSITHVMKHLGINDDEFRAYMVGYIVEQIIIKTIKETNE